MEEMSGKGKAYIGNTSKQTVRELSSLGAMEEMSRKGEGTLLPGSVLVDVAVGESDGGFIPDKDTTTSLPQDTACGGEGQ